MSHLGGGQQPSLSPHIKLQRASTAIDEITKALSDFSRSSTPEPFHAPLCSCCDEEGCETIRAWENDRSKLVDRLVLSAEIGQALLERHEAYVAEQTNLYALAQERITSVERSNDQAVSRMADLVRSKDNTEKRLAQARINLDIAESSNRTLLREVQEDRTNISKLNAQVARATGWEDRLAAVTLERDDLLQERDAEASRARSLELKLGAATSKCMSLQAEVNRLVDQLELHEQTSHHELSEEILRDAKARLDMLQHSLEPQPDNSEITRLLETLVADNEALKRDNAELRNFLGESRTEIRTLSDEVVELRASVAPEHPVDVVLKSSTSPPPSSHMPPPPSAARRPNHLLTLSTTSSTYRREGWASTFASSHSQPNSPPPYQLGFSRTTSPRMLLATLDDPETARRIRDISPGAATPITVESSNADLLSEGGDTQGDDQASATQPRRMRTLMLLNRSRGVQTDPTEDEHEHEHDDFLPALPHGLMRGHQKAYSFSDQPSTADVTSETSSISGMNSVTAPLPELIDRLSAILTRLSQTTVETLTTRLKRQNLLAGSDISYLSRSSIANIQTDVAQLRTHFRTSLEVDRDRQLEMTMTRKDLRNLLRFAKDVFAELGQLRAVVNDVTLDPMNAGNVLADAAAKRDGPLGAPGSSKDPGASKDQSWIAPITKLFAGTGPTASGGGSKADSGEPSGSGALRESATATSGGLSSAARAATAARKRPPPRAVPKLAAAVSSSSTTVNVEFSSRSKRAVSSTVVTSTSDAEGSGGAPSSSRFIGTSTVSGSGAAGERERRKPRRDDLLGIFAGAPPKVEVAGGESWVVLPRDKESRRQLRGSASTANFDDRDRDPNATVRRRANDRRARHRLSRNVDAIVDNIGQRPGVIGEENESAIVEDDGDADRDNDFEQTILERTRTLRPRGLSDSSIRSTFLAAGADGAGLPVNRLLTPASLALSSTDTSSTAMGMGVSFSAFDRTNVLKNLGKKMSSFASYYAPSPAMIAAPSASPEAGPSKHTTSHINAQPATISSSPPRPIPGAKSPMSPARRAARTAGGSPSSASPGLISNLLSAVVDPDWSDSEHAKSPRRGADDDRNWVRRERF